MISLIVGLGNAGIRYAETRHNLGYDLLDRISLKLKMRQRSGRGDYNYAEKEIDGRMVRLVWPTTFMNNSGLAVMQTMAAYNVPLEEILIIYDDYNIPLGSVRIRMNGSDGGHNGMESVITHMDSEEITRLRLGIGPVPDEIDPVQFVLGRFLPEEVEIKEKMLGKAGEAVLYLIKNRPEEAMSIYNHNPASDSEK
ncbi:MAG: aminoacyl-tRNA hydrolase [Candidatus Zixiibacteriota bacterium]